MGLGLGYCDLDPDINVGAREKTRSAVNDAGVDAVGVMRSFALLRMTMVRGGAATVYRREAGRL